MLEVRMITNSQRARNSTMFLLHSAYTVVVVVVDEYYFNIQGLSEKFGLCLTASRSLWALSGVAVNSLNLGCDQYNQVILYKDIRNTDWNLNIRLVIWMLQKEFRGLCSKIKHLVWEKVSISLKNLQTMGQKIVLD